MFYNALQKSEILMTDAKLPKGQQFTFTDLRKLYELFLTLTPVNNSIKETLAAPANIAALAAKGVPLDEVRGMLILYKNHSYSNWCSGSQKSSPELSSLVPLPWSAFKEAKGVPYESWKLESFALGHFMNTAYNEFRIQEYIDRYKALEEQLLNDYELMNWARKASVKPGREYSPYKIIDNSTYPEFTEEYNKGFGGTAANRWCRVLLLQIWLAGAGRSNRMILCPYDFDKVPEYIPTLDDRKKDLAAKDYAAYAIEELGF